MRGRHGKSASVSLKCSRAREQSRPSEPYGRIPKVPVQRAWRLTITQSPTWLTPTQWAGTGPIRTEKGV